MNPQVLLDAVKTLLAGDKNLLAMDQGNPTCNERIAKMAIPEIEEARRAYGAMIATASGLGDSISGAILYGETIRQQTSDGIPFLTPTRESLPKSRWIPERHSAHLFDYQPSD